MDNEHILKIYRTMVTIRLTEEQLAKSHQRGLVHGACHTYIGEEAIASSVCAHITDEDVVFSTHRGHGHALAKGVSPEALIAELYGRETGISAGRGGSMHLFAPEIGLMGTSGIVGPCILQACGGGYSFKLQGKTNVSLAFFGDGAVNNGAFHEGLNQASVWNLPCVFVVENNQFATEVPFEYSSGNPDVGDRGPAYGMPSFIVDGNDVQEIYEVAGEAIARARRGEGPTLIECKTYRTRAHAEGMGDFTYRTKEDVEEWKAKCPIDRFRAFVEESHPELENELDLIQKEITDEVEQAHKNAEQASYPSPEDANTFIYGKQVQSTIDNGEPLNSGLANDNDTAGLREITYMQATHEALSEEMAKNEHIFVMGEGIGSRGGNFNSTTGLYDLYGPERLCDTPICERGFVGLGGGAAMTGTRPVIDFMFADFILDAVGELINQIAKIQYMSSGRIPMPILLRGCIGIGHSAATHHSGSYYPMYSQVPGLRVVVPSTPYDAKGLMKRALNCDEPVLFLEHRELLNVSGPVPEEEYEIPFGKAAVLREGKDATVVALTTMVHKANAAIDILSHEGYSVELIDPRTVSPLDIETIANSVAKTGRLFVAEENFGPCGVASEIAAQIADVAFDELDAPIRRLFGEFTPTPYSPTLEAAVIPSQDDVTNAIRDLLNE